MARPLLRLLAALGFVALPLAGALGFAQDRLTSGLDLAAMNRAVEPCDDFFAFACGEWVAQNPIPADRPRWSRFDELQDRNNDVLRKILDGAAARPAGSTRALGDYYASCMDEAGIERKGLAPLAPLLKDVDELQSTARLPPLVARLQAAGVRALFGFGSEADLKSATMNIAGVWPSGLGLPDRDYYFRTDARSVALRAQYRAHVAAMLRLAGTDPDTARVGADAVMRLETALASASYDAVTRRDPVRSYHKMSLAGLQALTPAFEWAPYLKAAGAPPIGDVNVDEPDYIKKVNDVVFTTPLPELKTYLRWQLLRAAAPSLSSPFVNENFAFYGRALQGSRELRVRWRRCVTSTDADLSDTLGQAFVAQAFGGQAKDATLEMVRGIESALERDIQQISWMTDATRQQAIVKLKAVSNKIGYTDHWRDESRVRVVRTDFLGNRQRAHAFQVARDMARIGKPVDKSEWSMTPPTVNAYYDSTQNNINFPAGILQPPFYSPSVDPAVNYGAAGAVIGHELTHGFDDSGRQFDGGGNLKDWWTADDGKAFEERASCLVNQYSSYNPVEDVRLNGKLTLGENTADNGGVRLALMAYLASAAAKDTGPLEGFTPEQRFFIGYAQIWCESRRPEYERVQAQTDPHSPGRYRVNGVVSNIPEFRQAFSCKADAPMVRQPACRVW